MDLGGSTVTQDPASRAVWGLILGHRDQAEVAQGLWSHIPAEQRWCGAHRAQSEPGRGRSGVWSPILGHSSKTVSTTGLAYSKQLQEYPCHGTTRHNAQKHQKHPNLPQTHVGDKGNINILSLQGQEAVS